MNLFLASSIESSIDLCIETWGLNTELTPTLYIPTAKNDQADTSPLEERGSYRCLMTRNFQVTVCDLANTTTTELKDILSKTKLVVVGGGNTYVLLHYMKRIGFASLIKDFLSRGGLYVGSSAGSCVCSPDIAYIETQDDPAAAPNLADTKGLDLIDVDLYPHCIEPWYTDNYDAEYVIRSHQNMRPKIYLRDHQALLVRDDVYKIVS